jgi:uncharacterized Zn-finger protein
LQGQPEVTLQAVTDDEMRAKHADLQCEGRSLRFDHPKAKTIYVDLRVKQPHQLIYLAR